MNQKMRRDYSNRSRDGNQEKWFFSIVDVVGILTSIEPTVYWQKPD